MIKITCPNCDSDRILILDSFSTNVDFGCYDCENEFNNKEAVFRDSDDEN